MEYINTRGGLDIGSRIERLLAFIAAQLDNFAGGKRKPEHFMHASKDESELTLEYGLEHFK